MRHSDYINTVRAIVTKYLDSDKNKVFIFGSVALGSEDRKSDFDIGIEGEQLPVTIYFDIVDAFENSDIPYTVDVVDFNNVSVEFKKIAKKKVIPINY